VGSGPCNIVTPLTTTHASWRPRVEHPRRRARRGHAPASRPSTTSPVLILISESAPRIFSFSSSPCFFLLPPHASINKLKLELAPSPILLPQATKVRSLAQTAAPRAPPSMPHPAGRAPRRSGFPSDPDLSVNSASATSPWNSIARPPFPLSSSSNRS